TDFDEMLKGEKPDVLHICTPHYLHTPMALKALELGIHVLIEKPCSVTRGELALLRQAQEETGLKVGTCFQNRYNKSSIRLRELLADGEGGKLLGMRGFVTWSRGEAYYSDDWHGTLEKECGGVLINQAIHTLDLMQNAGGGVKSVVGHISNDHLKGVIEVEDTASALMEFNNGANGIFYATLAHTDDAPIMVDFIFEEYTLRLEGDNLYKLGPCGELEALEQAGENRLFGKACWGSGHTALIDDFYDSIRNDRPFEIDAFEGGKALETVLAIYRSSAQNTKEEV
ncbi:MAG TPA: Gfo/Idh/MocA family oxidoreductase, partial [Oscillospiraceae bacterium]|nr:Gfo/Idh/MocA family oxidoreductase [Oscillospiraceae bacterium]